MIALAAMRVTRSQGCVSSHLVSATPKAHLGDSPLGSVEHAGVWSGCHRPHKSAPRWTAPSFSHRNALPPPPLHKASGPCLICLPWTCQQSISKRKPCCGYKRCHLADDCRCGNLCECATNFRLVVQHSIGLLSETCHSSLGSGQMCVSMENYQAC